MPPRRLPQLAVAIVGGVYAVMQENAEMFTLLCVNRHVLSMHAQRPKHVMRRTQETCLVHVHCLSTGMEGIEPSVVADCLQAPALREGVSQSVVGYIEVG